MLQLKFTILDCRNRTNTIIPFSSAESDNSYYNQHPKNHLREIVQLSHGNVRIKQLPQTKTAYEKYVDNVTGKLKKTGNGIMTPYN